MNLKKKYRVVGLMSGTSLDGLDVACCEFQFGKKWKFHFVGGKTFSYSAEWRRKLSGAHKLSGESLMDLHTEYGRLLGRLCLQFMQEEEIKNVDFIASHGHTVFHQPKKGFTFQLGDGSSLWATAHLPVAYDFRSLDVALGGEGAPLVPIGDKLLFPEFDVCLNLGGIANISMDINKSRKAFDVCFCNMPLNYLMSGIGKSFDNGGKLAASGKVDRKLLSSIMRLYSNYSDKRPSLSREMFERSLLPIIDKSSASIANKLRTVCESIALEIAKAAPSGKKNWIVTGGGAFNTFLVELLGEKLKGPGALVIPPTYIIEFKEAIVFAFLGVLRARSETNVLSSVTRAARDSSSGHLIGF